MKGVIGLTYSPETRARHHLTRENRSEINRDDRNWTHRQTV